MIAADLPRVEPQRLARSLTADEVLKIAHLGTVPGVDPDDPRVEAIRWARGGVLFWEAIRQARQTGYLFVNRSRIALDADESTKLTSLWGWWCVAAQRPEVAIERNASTDGASVRCDLSPAGCRWTFAALAQITRLLAELPGVQDNGWLCTPDELQVNGLAMDDALTVARAVVAMVRAGRLVVVGR